MVSCELPQSYKVPFKECQNYMIDHTLVTIYVSLEWPDKAGDDGNIVIDVMNKKTSPKPCDGKTLMSYFQQNQPSSSVLDNIVHRQQENSASAYQQQQYYHHHYHPSAINNHVPSGSTTTMTAGDHNDVSSTTTTVVFNTIQPQSLASPTTFQQQQQQLTNDLNTQLSPVLRRQPSYLSSQHVIQTPPSNMNDSRLNMQMSTISPTSSTNQTPSIMTHMNDLQKRSTISYHPLPSVISPPRLLVCPCPQPNFNHEHNCPLVNLPKQGSNTTLPLQTIYRSPSDRILAPRTVFASRTRSDVSTVQLPIQESGQTSSMITATLAPFTNSNSLNTSGSTSDVTRIISQQYPFMNNNHIGQTIKLPQSNTENNFQQPSLNFSQTIHNQTNSIPKKTVVKQGSVGSNKPRQRKKSMVKQNSLDVTNQYQPSVHNLNDTQQQGVHIVNGFNSPTKQPNNSSPDNSSSPILLQQGVVIFRDDAQMRTHASPDNIKFGLVNDTKGSNAQQQLSLMNTMIRSPVELAVGVKTASSPQELDQVIEDVAKGQGYISINSSSTSSTLQLKQLSPSSTQLVREVNGPVTTKTYVLPLHQIQPRPSYLSNGSTLVDQDVVHIAQRVISSNITESNKINTPTTNNSTKRSLQTSIKKKTAKRIRNRKLTSSVSQTTITPSSQQNISGITFNQPAPWLNTQTSSSSSGSIITTTTTDTSLGYANQHLTSFDKNSSWPASGINNNVIILDPLQLITDSELGDEFYLDPHPESDFNNDIFRLKLTDQFNSLTPRPLLSISPPTNPQRYAPISTEKLPSTLTSPIDIYNDFFPLPSSNNLPTWQENQVTSSVSTPPDSRNQQFIQPQYYSPPDEYLDTYLYPQTSTSQISGTHSNQMNNNDTPTLHASPDQPSSIKTKPNTNKSLKHSSKISKQQTRPNPIQRQTSSTKPTCTRCGLTRLVDITHHEFPKQKGLVFECLSCGNNSIRSNVSDDERRRRLAKVAADHLNIVECQFCRKRFHSHNEYLMHLRNDHASNEPM